MNCAKLVQSQTNKKKVHTTGTQEEYTTITTSRRNENNNKFSMCECTNENNRKKDLV